jgi:hypothetical protein
MDLKETFAAIGSQMLSDFEHVHSQIKHMGERGSEREEGLKSFLEAYLPSRYTVSNGEIVDDSEQTSRQCDLVIYDRTNCPLMLAGKTYRVFPAEPVFAVVEVKSVLTNSELEDAVEKIRSAKRLIRHNGLIAGVIFAYKSGRKKDPIGEIASRLQELHAGMGPRLYVDLVCVLDAGVIQLVDNAGLPKIPADWSNRQMVVWHELSVPVLLWFYIHLLDLLDGQVTSSPNYKQYANILEIGVASFRDPRMK